MGKRIDSLRRVAVQAGRVLRALWRVARAAARVAAGREAAVLIDDRGHTRATIDLRRKP